MNCPKCEGVELSAVSYPIEDRSRPGEQSLELDLDQCPDCDGIWFDPGELDKYLGAKIKPMKVPKSSKKSAAELDAAAGACPRCALEMRHAPGHYNPGVTVEVCPKCGGTWVDGDEVDRAGGEALPFAAKMKALFGDVQAGGR
jgi:Zn-finger nucleic acid-binding protein